jgi:RNase P subunit RPR2
MQDVFISNYINDESKKKTLRDLKWKIAYIDQVKSTTKKAEVKWQSDYIITYCQHCKQQRYHKVKSVVPRQTNNGKWYIGGYYINCVFCQEVE